MWLLFCVQYVNTRCTSAVRAEYQLAASTPTSSQRKSPMWVAYFLTYCVTFYFF